MSAQTVAKLNFNGAKHLHLTGISPGVSASCLEACRAAIAKGREAGLTISFDPNIRKNLWPTEEAMRTTLNDLAAQCDLVLPGFAEGKLLTGADTPQGIAAFYRNRGVKTVVVKTGAEGAYYQTADGQCGHVAGFTPPAIVDTVGAGDAFAAGVITALCEGLPLPQAIARGNAMGALMVSVAGDNEGLPTPQQLQAFMAGAQRGE